MHVTTICFCERKAYAKQKHVLIRVSRNIQTGEVLTENM